MGDGGHCGLMEVGCCWSVVLDEFVMVRCCWFWDLDVCVVGGR